ncbi:HNH endonuclease [Bacillus marasmi]|uniref:HNH endonuclease n=1 Tax=Bacillus marasmi TaxID=1926279 RepID=UPI0011CB4D14|nr:HNH endonuclease [Bacillus marasmi]
MNTTPTAEDFSKEIERLIAIARDEGKSFIELVSADIHKNVGGYPSRNHRMATCCTIMYSLMNSRDEIISAPPKGKGASLKIRYYL